MNRVYSGDDSDDIETQELMDVKKLAEYTGFSKHYFYEMISEQRFPFPVYRFGRTLRFKKSEVNVWIEAHRCGSHWKNKGRLLPKACVNL